MWEIMEFYYDQVVERKDEGYQVERPFIYTIPKG